MGHEGVDLVGIYSGCESRSKSFEKKRKDFGEEGDPVAEGARKRGVVVDIRGWGVGWVHDDR